MGTVPSYPLLTNVSTCHVVGPDPLFLVLNVTPDMVTEKNVLLIQTKIRSGKIKSIHFAQYCELPPKNRMMYA